MIYISEYKYNWILMFIALDLYIMVVFYLKYSTH